MRISRQVPSSESSRRRPATALAATVAALAIALVALVLAPAAALAAFPEAPVTEAPNPLGSTTATLNGELNPGVATEKVAYRFAYSVGTECATSGLVAPVGPPFPEAEKAHKKVSVPVTGLEGNTEYSACLIAANPAEEAEATQGSTVTFTTLPEKPLIESQSSPSPTPFETTLEAQVNPENEVAEECKFEYGPTNTYGNPPAPCEQPVEGGAVETVTAHLTGLTPGETYHYRVVVKNATGEAKGSDQTVTMLTLEDPIVESAEQASAITATSATLEGAVNPNYQETTSYGFEYATDPGLAGATTALNGGTLGAGFGAQPVSVAVTGLAPGTTYYYRVIATDATGTTKGTTIEHFTTQDTPVVTAAGTATGATRTTVTFSGGEVNPAGAATTYRVAFITLAGYEEAAAAGATNPFALARNTPTASAGEAYTPQAVGSATVGELSPGTTYAFAIIATNAVGSQIGPVGTFTTLPPTPPLVTTGGAEGVSQLSATITGAVDTRGLHATIQFELGTSAGTMSPVPATVNPESILGTTVGVSATFSGSLQAGTTYYYRVVASSSDGTTYGAEQSFTTGSFPGPSVTTVPLVSFPQLATAPAPKTTPVVSPPKAKKCPKGKKLSHGKCVKVKAKAKKKAKKKHGHK